MTDIATRLRRYGQQIELCNEAADEIERLREELAQWKAECYMRWEDIPKRAKELQELERLRK